MALIKCPECGKEVSDKSHVCIGCGCPMDEILKTLEESAADSKPESVDNDIKNVDLNKIMEETSYSKVKSIAMLRDKTGLSLAECKLIFDEPYKKLEKPPVIPQKSIVKVTEYKRKCNSCGAIFLSSQNICCSCNSSNTSMIQEEKPESTQEISSDKIKCSRCGSTQITSKTKGFGLGKAAAGGLLLGPVGLLGGVIGSKKVRAVCLKCGNEWDAGI